MFVSIISFSFSSFFFFEGLEEEEIYEKRRGRGRGERRAHLILDLLQSKPTVIHCTMQMTTIKGKNTESHTASGSCI